jgi:hypothetical protein
VRVRVRGSSTSSPLPQASSTPAAAAACARELDPAALAGERARMSWAPVIHTELEVEHAAAEGAASEAVCIPPRFLPDAALATVPAESILCAVNLSCSDEQGCGCRGAGARRKGGGARARPAAGLSGSGGGRCRSQETRRRWMQLAAHVHVDGRLWMRPTVCVRASRPGAQ